MSQQARGRKRFAEQSLGDLARSLLLLLALVGGIWALGKLVSEDPASQASPVDYSGQLAAARDTADYRVVAPRALGAGWVPTSAEFQASGGTVRWHLGFLTPQDEYVGLEQGDYDFRALLNRYVGRLRPVGPVRIGGQSWTQYAGETDNAVVRREGDVVTIVVGTAPPDALRSFAASLR